MANQPSVSPAPVRIGLASFNPLSRIRRRLRTWAYTSISIVVAIAIVFGQPQVTMAQSLFGNLFQILQLSSISDRQEISLGGQINQELINQRQIRIYNNPSLTSYVNQIGQRLAAKSNRPSIPYVFQVVDDKAVNAFATMGGYVYVNTGLLQLADNEAELASVMSHEIGHIVGRHAIQQMRQAAITQGLASAVGLNRNVLVKLGTDIAIKRRGSRQHEFEADQLGFDALGKASYAQGAMIDFFKKLVSASKGRSVPTILSTHPSTQDRIATLEAKVNPTTAYVGDGLNSQSYKVSIRPL